MIAKERDNFYRPNGADVEILNGTDIGRVLDHVMVLPNTSQMKRIKFQNT
jgi:hypothetical protein